MTTENALARLRAELGKLQVYAVPDATGFVKLDAMENPYPWPDSLRKEWLSCLSKVNINRYPEPAPIHLIKKLCAQFGPAGEAGILLGNGSDELIQLLALAIAKPGASILTVNPSFSMYQMIAEMVGIPCHIVSLRSDFALDVNAMLVAIKKYDPALTFIAFPNNPTGTLWSKQDILQIVQASKGFVVVDEAYGPFTDQSFVDELEKYSNLLLLRTASKLGLAGIRFGWLSGNTGVIAELNKLRLPYNINQLTQLTMEFALDHYGEFQSQAKKICQSRSTLYEMLVALNGVEPVPSSANFILFKVTSGDADQVFDQLLAQKILIKNVGKQPGLANCLRVTVGTDEENMSFMKGLENALKS